MPRQECFLLKSCPGYPARPGSGGVKGLKVASIRLDSLPSRVLTVNNHVRTILKQCDPATDSGAIGVCESCGFYCNRLTLPPELEYLGCDDCMEEAMAVLLREAGATPAEASAFARTAAQTTSSASRVACGVQVPLAPCPRFTVET
jgi:hypothetical protein